MHSVRAIAPRTCTEALMSRPCSSQVYHVTPTPASSATSSRRRPGGLGSAVIGSIYLARSDGFAATMGLLAVVMLMIAGLTRLLEPRRSPADPGW